MRIVKNRFVRKVLGLDPLPRPVAELYSIGRHTYGEPYVADLPNNAQLRIGSFCSIAAGVTIVLGGNHRADWIALYPFTGWHDRQQEVCVTKGDVVIGNDVWIGLSATILSGVRVGNGAVIGAEAVVASDVPAYGIVVGNPARLVRKRFSDEQIATLERIAWWDWPDEKIKNALPLLLSANIAGLAEFAEKSRNFAAR
jgi:acetyltransferase-like isoleucine patch superfamily enzyme